MKHFIRPAGPGDIPSLYAIYSQYIDTDITMEYSLPGPDDYRRSIEAVMTQYTCLVMQSEERITGYCYAHPLREREGYQWSAELSIYLDRGHTANSLGSCLYKALLALIELQGIRTVYAVIMGGNQISLRFHEKLGFEPLAVFRSVGYKNGHWLDAHWLQLRIAGYDVPSPFIPFSSLDPALAAVVIEKANAAGIAPHP